MIAVGWAAFAGLMLAFFLDELGDYLARRRRARVLDELLDELSAAGCDERLLEAIGATRHSVTTFRPIPGPYDWQEHEP